MESPSSAPLPPDRERPRTGEVLLELAATADLVAQTIEHKAALHDEIAQRTNDPQAQAEANRLRRLAAAERTSAEALQDGRTPPAEVREVIRKRGRGADSA